MNNNPYLLELLVNDKLTALRAEGMRDQMLARAGLQNHRKLLFPDLRRFFHRMLVRVTSHSLRRIEQPGIRKTLVH